MQFICEDCGRIFDEEDFPRRRTTYESEYGAYDPFHTSLTIVDECCPFCKSEDIKEYSEDEEEDEE